jgi:hypothetical protein
MLAASISDYDTDMCLVLVYTDILSVGRRTERLC